MASTRLLKADREAICDALIKHRFAATITALDEIERALGDKVHRRLHKGYLSLLDDAPEGAFPNTSYYKANVSGKLLQLTFEPRRCFSKYQRYDACLAVPETDPLGAEILAWAENVRSQAAAKRDLERQTSATLAKFSTFESLVKAWPDAERFITAEWRSRNPVIGLPAIRFEELSAALDLPPQDIPEAA